MDLSFISKVYFNYWFLVAAVLENIFPEIAYLFFNTFTGPTSMFDYSPHIYDGLLNIIDVKLQEKDADSSDDLDKSNNKNSNDSSDRGLNSLKSCDSSYNQSIKLERLEISVPAKISYAVNIQRLIKLESNNQLKSTKDVDLTELKLHAAYCLRVESFFKNRMKFFKHCIELKDPFPQYLKKSRSEAFKSRKLSIKENQIVEFNKHHIGLLSYPDYIIQSEIRHTDQVHFNDLKVFSLKYFNSNETQGKALMESTSSNVEMVLLHNNFTLNQYGCIDQLDFHPNLEELDELVENSREIQEKDLNNIYFDRIQIFQNFEAVKDESLSFFQPLQKLQEVLHN
ncbi:uncharacterized protein ASCRUDRAFT_78053 [Ascoidea rubescens DSM 1968]|uniref:Uncharacterized protein n=1 Tax=Ascoidea rubescens DSM 1968 TaxID=1344418 RepID=A0A1D2V8Z2_9ASCO|nr:hypothetical protein ASCRUDRAFT_78053 [Ascoidea rubescens DSM 1968]ODV58131.1 hypothetical protein ASCRUDRAFT_78053 [Ascoidea rubescens DSM 1968]